MINFAPLNKIGRMMAADFLNISLNMLPPLSLDSDGFIRFGIFQGGGCEVPHRCEGYLLPDIHLFIFPTISED